MVGKTMYYLFCYIIELEQTKRQSSHSTESSSGPDRGSEAWVESALWTSVNKEGWWFTVEGSTWCCCCQRVCFCDQSRCWYLSLLSAERDRFSLFLRVWSPLSSVSFSDSYVCFVWCGFLTSNVHSGLQVQQEKENEMSTLKCSGRSSKNGNSS